MKTKTIFSFVLTALLLIGCQSRNHIEEQLAIIDTLLSHDKVDSAFRSITAIPLSTMSTEADSAYYYLVRTEIYHRNRMPPHTDNGISYAVRYYEKKSDKEMLARAYFYKGISTYNKNRMQQTIHLLKQAEGLADRTDNLLLQYKIYEALAYYNGEAFENELHKIYAKKALDVAKTLNDKERQSSVLLYLVNYYIAINEKDSALICINECAPLLKSMAPSNLPYYYFNMGRIYEKDDPQLAKAYLKKAIAIKGIPNAYKTLANIYMREDSMEKVREMWRQALYSTRNTKMNTMRVDIFNTMRQQAMEHGDYRQANALADSAARWTKQFYEVQQQERLNEIQAKYDKKVAEQEILNKVYGWGLVVVGIGGLLIIGLGYYSYRGMKTAKQLAETQAEMALYTQKAKELEASGEQNTKELIRLNRKISELQQRQAGILANGKRLYDALQSGATTVRWGKADFTDFIEYYKLKDLAYVNDLQTDYDRLSPKYMFFAILQHEGRTDEEIMRIMGISESTMRSTRSRINSKIRG